MQGAFELREAEAARKQELLHQKQRQVLELHDGVIQGFSVAKLGLELDRGDESREALLQALENARDGSARQGDAVAGERLIKVEPCRVGV